MFRFQSNSQLSPESASQLAATNRANPFYTLAYIEYRRAQGFQPWLLYLEEHGKMTAACSAFMKSGTLGRILEIPSLPKLEHEMSFWNGLLEFSLRARVTDLMIGTFASPEAKIPALSRETWRKRRCEYVINCQHPDLWKQMRKGHWYSVKRGRKAGLTVRRGIGPEVCNEHARLVKESLTRRVSRGESVSWKDDVDLLLKITRNNAGEIFQAMLGDKVLSSNLVLMADRGAYNHSQGASREGLDYGAPHFLIYETVSQLRNTSVEVFNLGGTDQLGSGLEQFKSGFGATTSRIELEAVEFCLTNPLVDTLRKAIRLVRRTRLISKAC